MGVYMCVLRVKRNSVCVCVFAHHVRVMMCACVCVCVCVCMCLHHPTDQTHSSHHLLFFALPHAFLFPTKKNVQFSVLDKASAAGVKGGEGREGEDGGAGDGQKDLTVELAKYGFGSQAHVRVLVSMYKARQFLVMVRFCFVCVVSALAWGTNFLS